MPDKSHREPARKAADHSDLFGASTPGKHPSARMKPNLKTARHGAFQSCGRGPRSMLRMSAIDTELCALTLILGGDLNAWP